MSRHLHLTPLGGIAGDMFAAALLDAFPDLVAPVLAEVTAVLPEGHPPVALVPVDAGGLRSSRFEVPAFDMAAPVLYPDMAARIATADLLPETARIAAAILRLLAGAEAEVHGCAVEAVHFHEIADWDTLADVVAAGALIGRLGASWSLDPLPLGGGTVRTRHGVMPVPAPATAALLRGLPVQDDGIGGERVTPTGAAIARYLARDVLPRRPAGRFGTVGRGAGSRSLPDRPNVLVATEVEVASIGADRVTVIAFDVDDMTGEEIAAACEALRDGGALDVTTQTAIGKKGRIATAFRVLARDGTGDAVAELCFALTSTIGLRLREERRLILPRAASEAGGMRVKRVARPGGDTAKAESDDLAGAPSLAARRRLARLAEGDL